LNKKKVFNLKINCLIHQDEIRIPPEFLKNVPKTKEVIADNLMRMLMDGPLVSFNGSPTVSPTTAALCASECLTKVNLSPSSLT